MKYSMKTSILMFCLALATAMAQAQVNYAVSGNTAYVTNSPNASGNVVIASTYDGYPVTSIGDWAFNDCYSLTNVVIGEIVTGIGRQAFSSCTSLASVIIPSSVTNIGVAAFAFSGLTSAIIGTSVTSIGGGAFYSCQNLTNLG